MSGGQLLSIGENGAVLAIGPSVLASGQAEFKKGILYFRTINDIPENLFFTCEDITEAHDGFFAHKIAELQFGEAGVGSNDVYAERLQYGQKNSSGDVVKFHEASDANLKLLFSLWYGKEYLTDWLRKFDEKVGLTTEEKQRLRRIASGFIK